MRFRMSFDNVSWELAMTNSITEQQLLAKIEAEVKLNDYYSAVGMRLFSFCILSARQYVKKCQFFTTSTVQSRTLSKISFEGSRFGGCVYKFDGRWRDATEKEKHGFRLSLY